MFTPKDMHKRKSKFVIDEQFKDDGACSGYEGGTEGA